ncbi:MAG: hypothetical protein SNJ33_06270 [Rikenellaceae bacterium]
MTTSNLLVSVEEIADLAFNSSEYIPDNTITLNHIRSVQERYITPIIGEDLCQSVADGLYVDLYDNYILPVMGELVRIEVDLDAYPTHRTQRVRVHTLLELLSNHLNDNEESYPEYDSAENVMNRCTLVGGFVL